MTAAALLCCRLLLRRQRHDSVAVVIFDCADVLHQRQRARIVLVHQHIDGVLRDEAGEVAGVHLVDLDRRLSSR